MAGETPDYRRLNVQTVAFPITDLGEIPARLGAPGVYDRRGDVYFTDDFSHGLGAWEVSLPGSIIPGGLSRDHFRTGGWSVHMATGPNAADQATMRRFMAPPPLGKTGVYLAFEPEQDFTYLQIRPEHHDGTRLYRFAARFNRDDRTVTVLDSDGAFKTAIGDVGFPNTQDVWSDFKLVVDLSTGVYERVLFNRTAVDISQYAALDVSSTSYQALDLLLTLEHNTGIAGSRAYVDQVVLTHGEPANGI